MADLLSKQVQIVPVTWRDPRAVALRDVMDIEMSAIYGSCFSSSEPDEVDRYIVEHVTPHDLVITADIPLAAAVVDKQALAISPRGEIYTAANVQERLAVRNLLQQLRSDGLVLGGPTVLSAADCQRFAAALDRSLTSLLNQINNLR